MGIVRSRQETVNKRFKQWGILVQTNRQDIVDHVVVTNIWVHACRRAPLISRNQNNTASVSDWFPFGKNYQRRSIDIESWIHRRTRLFASGMARG